MKKIQYMQWPRNFLCTFEEVSQYQIICMRELCWKYGDFCQPIRFSLSELVAWWSTTDLHKVFSCFISNTLDVEKFYSSPSSDYIRITQLASVKIRLDISDLLNRHTVSKKKKKYQHTGFSMTETNYVRPVYNQSRLTGFALELWLLSVCCRMMLTAPLSASTMHHSNPTHQHTVCNADCMPASLCTVVQVKLHVG